MKKLFTTIVSLILVISLTSCGSSVSDRALKKMLKENGYSYDDCEVEKVYSLKKDLKDFDNDKNNKLILIDSDDDYSIAVANTKSKRLVMPKMSYIPLEIVQNEIFENDKDTNLRCVDVYKKYIENNGVQCFSDKAISEAYLRELTGVNGILPTMTAQNAIKNNLAKIFPDMTSPADVDIIFESNSAVPMYYAKQGASSAYNWTHVMTEESYKAWNTTASEQTKAKMIAQHGPAYTSGNTWTVYDTNMSIVQAFASKEQMEQTLKANTYAMPTGPVPATQQASNAQASDGTNTLYYVRITYEDATTQKGAFETYENAKALADANASLGYKVFDTYGNLLYTPTVPKPTEASTPSYYVRKSANDQATQQGAYNVLQNAKNAADANKNAGYKVYDKYGNLIYAPTVYSQPASGSQATSGAKTVNGAKYRVRKSANDAKSQIGAYSDLGNAKAAANSNSGYKVYDMNGNLIYAP